MVICVQPAKDWETGALSAFNSLGLSGPRSAHVQSDRYPFDLQEDHMVLGDRVNLQAVSPVC